MKKIFGIHSKKYVIDNIKKILYDRLILDQYHKLLRSTHQQIKDEETDDESNLPNKISP